MEKLFSLFIPSAHAALLSAPSGSSSQGINDIIQAFIIFFSDIIILAGLGAIAAFFWGIARFIWNTSDENKIKEGKQWMLWSIVALFCMVTLWGLLGFIVDSVRVNPEILPPLGQ
jgi:hypothetical protein